MPEEYSLWKRILKVSVTAVLQYSSLTTKNSSSNSSASGEYPIIKPLM
jgi:hypothetical protein